MAKVLIGNIKEPETLKRLGLSPAPAAPPAEPYKDPFQYAGASVYARFAERPVRAVAQLGLNAYVSATRFAEQARPEITKRIEKKLAPSLQPAAKKFIGKVEELAGKFNQPGPIEARVLAKEQEMRGQAYSINKLTGALYDTSVMAQEVLSLIGGMKMVGKLLPTKTIPGHMAKIAVHGFATTPGGFEERKRSALWRMAYNITPHLANATGATGWTARSVDVALNSLLSAHLHSKAYKQHGFSPDFWAIAAPTFMMDIVMAWGTRGLPQNKIRAAENKYYKVRAKELGISKDLYRTVMKDLRSTVASEAGFTRVGKEGPGRPGKERDTWIELLQKTPDKWDDVLQNAYGKLTPDQQKTIQKKHVTTKAEPPKEETELPAERLEYKKSTYERLIKDNEDNKPGLEQLDKELVIHREDIAKTRGRGKGYINRIQRSIDRLRGMIKGEVTTKQATTLKGLLKQRGLYLDKTKLGDFGKELRQKIKSVTKRNRGEGARLLSPDDLAKTLQEEGILTVPAERHADEYLIEKLAENMRLEKPGDAEKLVKEAGRQERKESRFATKQEREKAKISAQNLDKELYTYTDKQRIEILPEMIKQAQSMPDMERKAMMRVLRPEYKKLRQKIQQNIYKQRIEAKRDTMIEKGEMTPKAFSDVVQSEGTKIDAMTEGSYRALVYRMEAEKEHIMQDMAVEEALKDNPRAVEIINRMDGILKQGLAEGKIRINRYQDVRYYFQAISIKLGDTEGQFYKAYENIITKKNLVRNTYVKGLMDRVKNSTPEYDKIVSDEARLTAISDFIKSRYTKPGDLNTDEIALAMTMRDVWKEFEPMVRYLRFIENYLTKKPIPDAPRDDLRQAARIYEEQGKDALLEFLKTKDWGIIKSGYQPTQLLKPEVGSTGEDVVFGKTHIKTRTGIEYLPQEKNVMQRLYSYMNQMLNLYHLEPEVQRMINLFDRNAESFDRPHDVADDLTRWLMEVKGQTGNISDPERIARRLASQVYAAVFFDVRKWTRNLFQNLAFYPNQEDLVNARNKPMTEEDKTFFAREVTQKAPLASHYMFTEEVPYRGFRFLTSLARRVGLYPMTDEVNRTWAFWAKTNRVRRAFTGEKSVDQMAREAGLYDLEPLQIKKAMEIYAGRGVDSMARFVAKEVTNNVHFLYERSQRSVAEMGPIGRVIMNLFVFPKSYAQRAIKDGAKMFSKDPDIQQRGFNNVARLVGLGIAMGGVYQGITGDTKNPYSPFQVLTWGPGGLTLGSIEELGDLNYFTLMALQGDRIMIDKVILSIARIADVYVPFYDEVINALEAMSGMKSVDTYALRRIRQAVDSRYRVAGGKYKVKRDSLSFLQKLVFGKGIDVSRQRREFGLMGMKVRSLKKPRGGIGRWIKREAEQEKEATYVGQIPVRA